MMEAVILLIILFVIVFPIVALVKSAGAVGQVEELRREVERLRRQISAYGVQAPHPPVVLPPQRSAAPHVEQAVREPAEAWKTPVPEAEHWDEKTSTALPRPVLPPMHVPPVAPAQVVQKIAPPATRPARAAAAVPKSPPLSLEQFMGARLFAWVGGLALFFGIVFFVKLSIERGWLPPGLRVGIGFVTGLALLAAGWQTQKRKPFAVLAHTLCATGIVVLYSVCYAAHALYEIPPFHHALVTFLAMSLNTAAAFWLAGRMKTQVVAVLGMLGGFLTPVLCSTGVDNPFGLFSYIALLDLGVLAVAHRQRWLHLIPLAAVGTVLIQVGWVGAFFNSSGYAFGSATWVPVSVFLGFAALFLAACWRSDPKDSNDGFAAGSAVLLALSAMLLGFGFLTISSILSRPAVLYTLVLGVNVLTMLLAWRKGSAFPVYFIFTGMALLHLIAWTMLGLTLPLLPWALGIYLLFGIGHTAFALMLQKRPGAQQGMAGLIGWVPVVSLGLILLPVLWLRDIGPVVWLAILISCGLVMGLAFRTRQLLPVLGALILTFITAGIWFVRTPSFALGQTESLGQFLWVVGGFAVLFAGAGAVLGRRSPDDAAGRWLPVAAAGLPFVLLIVTVFRLHLPDPAAVFRLALGLAVFLLGLARYAGQPRLAPTALACVLGLVLAWLTGQGSAARSDLALGWIAVFYGLFVAFPFVFRHAAAEQTYPWMTLGLTGLGFFLPTYVLMRNKWPDLEPGFIPAAFAVLPLLAMEYVRGSHGRENPARLSQLAWLAGTGLFFLTLIFPVQFEKQWITLGWALEGAALCWLTRRVPHPGLSGLGAGLLVTAFVRLALNPASYSGPVSVEAPMLNWQLYAFSTVTAALFAAAACLKPGQDTWEKFGLPLRGLFRGLGGILLFLLLNIEIASAFTPLGETLSLQSPGTDFARAMTTTISWSLFALALLSLGFWKRNALTRYAGIGLLVAALLKLFFHDLARTGSGYRIGAFIVVALIALAASWLYQRFLTETAPPAAADPTPEEDLPPPPDNTTPQDPQPPINTPLA